MKKISITIEYYEYSALYQIFHGIKSELEKRAYVLSGVNLVPNDLVLVSMLTDRFLFLYPPEDTYKSYGPNKAFNLELYQLFALNNYLNHEINELPQVLYKFQEHINKIVEPYTFKAVETEFEKYFKAELSEMYGDLTYTELRDEMPWEYDYLYKQFLSKNERQNNSAN